MQPLEYLKNASVVLRGDADAVVGHGDLPQRALLARRDPDLRLSGAKLDGVGQQVLQ